MTTEAPGREWLLRLTPRGEVGLGQAASSPATVGDAVARVGDRPVRWAVEVGREMAVTITGEIPQFGGGEGPFETLRMGTESSVLRCLVLLAQGGVGLTAITPEALEGDREFVRRNIPLDKVLRGIRLGHAGMAQAFLRACETHVEQHRLADEMKAVSEELFSYVDSFADSMVQEYLAERDRWTTSAAAARTETVRAILACEPLDAGAAAGVLGYALDRCHLALTLWTASGTAGDTSALQRTAVDLLRARGATATLVVPIGSAQLWAWGAVRTAPYATEPAPPAVERDEDVCAAFGLPAAGIDGFRRSHREAVQAERIGRLAGRGHRLVDHADVAAVALLGTDLAAAGEFARRELGALAAAGEQTAALRRTLLSYLEHERSLVSVARELHVARGTVAYRVKRAEQLLGRDVSHRRFELHAALLLADRLGDAVLTAADP